MNLLTLLISLTLVSLQMLKQVSAHQHGHACQHDPSILEKIMPQEYYDSIEEMSQNRKMAGASPQPFRVTTDYSYLDDPANGAGMDSTKKNYIIKIMKAAQMFLKNFIKVIPRSTPIKKRGSVQCYDINVPADLQSNGVTNSDLHILVTFENSPGSSALANAVACDYDPGPIVGRIKFNIGTMKNIGTTAQGFESDFATAIHELTHVLGFSSSAMQYWIDPDTNQPYLATVTKIQVKDTVRGVANVIKLKSKNVVDTARRYYNCPTLDSVPMENQGGSGSFGSHWERDLIQNEYMTASAILGHAIISEFTAALLVDTGFYAEINSNMLEKGYWGRGKGCDFIYKSCDDTNQYPEFTYEDKDKCDFYSVGYGTLASDPFSQCKVIQDYSNAQCFDDTQMAPNQIRRNNSGPGSKCFTSTSIDKRYTASGDSGLRCHKYTCNADNSSINVILWKDANLNIQVTCSSQNQVIDLSTVSADTKGSLTCPSNFALFCNFPKSCTNFCNGNGICSNAVCYCLDGFAGDDCSKQCPSPQVWDGTQCVLNCSGSTFLNPDNTCKTTCPKAYFKNTAKNTCDLCHKACSICTDSSVSSCSECNTPYVLKGTTCQDPSTVVTCDSSCLTCSGSANNQCLTCSDGRFLDTQNQCSICQTPCQNCTNSTTKCTSCITDYTYNSSNNTCSPICDTSCLTCSSPKDATKCLTCSNGYFLNAGKCQKCQSPCSNCVESASKCLSCITNYTFDNPSNSCKPNCDSSCKTCSQPIDSNSCLSCNDGSYLDSTKCKACQSPCKTCDSLSTKCLSCVSNYTYDSTKNICNPICDASCKNCSKPIDPNSCTSCNDESFLDGSKCTLCTSPCKTCDTSSTKCLSCITNYSFDSSKNICNLSCDSTCKSCSKPNDINSCLTCNDGAFLDGTKCTLCTLPCKTCDTSSTKCQSCIINYTFDSSKNQCNPDCDTSCKTCSKPKDANQCLSCNDGAFLDGTKCTLCTSPCKTCDTSSTKCLQCIANYTFDSSKNQCNPDCDTSCKTCSKPKDANQCLSCNDGTFLDGTKCTLCISPCKTCDTSSSKCLSCVSSYQFDNSNNKCNPTCDVSCKTCSKPIDPNQCLSCNDGFFLDGSKCTACSSPCKTCDSTSTKCLACIANYTYDNSKNICNPTCDTSCKNCSKPIDSNACTSCNDGSFLDGSKCTICTSPCKTCDTSATKCLSCITGFSYDTSNSICNPNCDSSCKSCSKPNDGNACLTCNDGTFLDGTKCTLCTSPCKTCDTLPTKCSSCITNYTFDSSKNQCNPDCDTSCKTCSKPKDSNQCLSCNDGAFLDGTKCTLCTSPCKTCNSLSTKCQSCVTNYTFDNTKNQCNPDCDASCKTCSKPKDANQCLSCNDGFFLDGNKCTACAQPCKTCSDKANKCLSCLANYTYDSANSICNADCDTSCKTCLNPKDQNSCLSCNDGFFLEGSKCSKCAQPCNTCESKSQKCLSCITNYTLDLSQNICNPICDSSCKSCIVPKDPTKCQECNKGFYLASGSCLQCSSPCKECIDSDSKCISCLPNYSFDNLKNTCTPVCDSSCKSCSQPQDSTKCTSCQDGSFLLNGKCSLCKLPCSTCENKEDQCLSCQTNYLFDHTNKTCQADCDSSCKTCSFPKDSNQCLSCKDGYFLSGKQCLPCDSPCKTCNTSSSTCFSCISDTDYQYKLATNKCEPICDSSCLTCSEPKNPFKCTSCNDGTYFNSNQCQKCQAPCLTCNNVSNQCLSCIDSKYTYDNATNTCKSFCHTSCKTCSNPDDANSCTSCFDGSFLNGSTCQSCQAPCQNCQNSGSNCLSCISGYQFKSSNTCEIICASQCKTCSKPLDDKSCISCADGYFLSSTQCLPCQAPCQNCVDSANKCSSCKYPTDYKFVASNNQCQMICDSTCKTCSEPNNPIKCLDCPDGSYLINGECKKCTSLCGNCQTSPSKCLSCISSDYTLNSSSNTCEPICDTQCKLCSSPKDASKCTSCLDGFYLDGGSCKKCSSPCSNCIDNDQKCTQCIDNINYKFDAPSNKCIKQCHYTCKDCSDPQDISKCISCNDGFYLDSGLCKKCISPCSTCKNSTECLTCETGYTFDVTSNKCQPQCDSSCLTCNKPNDANSCLSCKDGSFLNNLSQCLPCKSPCQKCSVSADKCTSCITNYNLNILLQQCSPICDSSCKTCSEAKDSSKCLSCQDGYFFTSNTCQKCKQPCQTCQDQSDKCLSCITSDFTYDASQFKCTSSCHSSCKTCSGPSQSNCTSCFDSFYLDNSQCKACLSPCDNCTKSQDNCTSCINGYTLNTNKCEITCDSSCQTCSAPKNPNNCTSCKDGFYLNKGQCKSCQSPCSKCSNAETQCTDCIPNYKLESNQCKPVCDKSCKNCSNPINNNSCLSCFDGYYLSGSQCLKCNNPCATCITNSSKCLTCQTGYQLSQKNPNTCEPQCDSSCLTCSSNSNPNACLSCADGRYLESNQCKLCPINCLTCTSFSKCQSCKQNYGLDLKTESCQIICDKSCLSCSQPNNPKACLSCTSNKILIDGTCQDCPKGQYFNFSQCSKCSSNCKVCKDSNTCDICEDGFSLDSKKSCKQNTQSYKCHYTCNTCSGTLYSHCTSCAGNRVLNDKSSQTKSSQIVGTCDCPSGTSDFNQPFCDQSKIQESIKTTETAFLISSGSTTTVLAIVSANPLILGSLIEFSQTISFFTYVNEKPALGFDDVAQNLYLAHITKIFNFNGMRKDNSSRLLQSTSTQNDQGVEGFNSNSKIPLNDKYPEFVVNALAILVLTGLAWSLSALTSIITISDPNSFTAKIKKIFCISFTICIFVLTSQEFSLLIFFQFQQLGMENSVDTASAFLSFIVFAYILGFLGYLFYKLNYQQVLTKPTFIAQSALKTSTKVHPVFGVDICQAKQKKTIANPDYYTFYILHLYIKQNNFLNRAFIQIIVIRKIITSLIMTFGYQNPITQVSILLVLYLTYWLYIILSRPFKEVKHMILYSAIETITLSMYILYLVLLNNDSDNEKQKIISLVMLILILMALLFYLLVSFIYLVLFAVQCLNKCGEKHNDIAVVNVSNHFEKDQSNIQFNQQPIQESKIYTKPLDLSSNPNNQQQQHKIISYVKQDKINCSITNNQSMIQENQNLSKQIISDTVLLESPMRSKSFINIQQQQQQQDNLNTTNRIRMIQGYQINKLYPQDDILPEKISQSKIPDIFNEPLNYSRASKAKKFQDIF
ncbi:hypothetical protein ABPG72_022544 [Tetrahymena utriculariae]